MNIRVLLREIFMNAKKFDFLTNLIYYAPNTVNSNDISGYAHNGTVVGALTYPANYGDFNGGYYHTPDVDDLSFTDGVNDVPFTIMVPFYIPSSSPAGFKFLIGKRVHTGNNREWTIYYNGGAPITCSLQNYNNSNGILIESVTSGFHTPDSWQVLIWRYDGSGLASGMSLRIKRIEVGVPVTTGTYTGQKNGTSKMYVGTFSNNPGTSSFYGRMKHIAIWRNRVLTVEECNEASRRAIANLLLIT